VVRRACPEKLEAPLSLPEAALLDSVEPSDKLVASRLPSGAGRASWSSHAKDPQRHARGIMGA